MLTTSRDDTSRQTFFRLLITEQLADLAPMNLIPLPYHKEISAHFESLEPGLFDWFKSDNFSNKFAETAKLELLKSTYRMSEGDHPEIYSVARKARDQLEIDIPITIYQAQNLGASPNAALVFFPEDLSIVLVGGIVDLLDESELLALFGHEISHHKLYTADSGKYFSTARLLEWCCGQFDCHAAYLETDRRYQLYTEVFADIGALIAAQDKDAAVSCLIKVSTGLREVSAASYLEQADEVIKTSGTGSQGDSHPELFIRAKVLDAIALDPSNIAKVRHLVEGSIETASIDLIGQRDLSRITGALIDTFTMESFLRSEDAEVLARQYFPNFQWAESSETAGAIAELVAPLGKSAKEYLAYVLLDFAMADPDGEDLGLASGLLFADYIGMFGTFEPIARKELRRKKEQMAQLRRAAPDMIAKASDA